MVDRWSVDGVTYCPIKRSDGAFVRYSDYATLEAQLAEVKAASIEAKKLLYGGHINHAKDMIDDILSALEATPPAVKLTVKPLDNDYPISEVASWLANQATRDYAGHEVDALKLAARILAALTAAQESG